LAVWLLLSSRARHTRFSRDWSSAVCSSDLKKPVKIEYYKGLRQGLATMREAGVDSLLITDNDEKFLGVVDVRDIQANLGKKKKLDRKSTRLNSSHVKISYAVFCLKKKTKKQ